MAAYQTSCSMNWLPSELSFSPLHHKYSFNLWDLWLFAGAQIFGSSRFQRAVQKTGLVLEGMQIISQHVVTAWQQTPNGCQG